MLFKKRENRRSYDTQSMDKLRQLTEQIVERMNGNVDYGNDKTGENLYWCEEIAVQKAFMPVGTKFDIHSHDSIEYLIIYSGSGTACTDKGNFKLRAGESICFQPKERHGFETLEEDCKVIGITIPAAEGYPK